MALCTEAFTGALTALAKIRAVRTRLGLGFRTPFGSLDDASVRKRGEFFVSELYRTAITERQG